MAKASEKPSPDILLAGESAVLESETPAELAFDTVLNSLEAETRSVVWIWRITRDEIGRGHKGKDVFLATMSPVEYLDYGLRGIQMEYGEGTYKVQLNGDDGRPVTGRVFYIGPPSLRQRKEFEAQKAVAAPVQSSSGSDVAMLARVMQEGFGRLAELMMQQGNSRAGFLSELVQYKTLFSPNGQAATPTADPFSMMKSAVDLVKELGVGNGAKETSTADIFIKLAEQFGPAIADMARVQAVSAARAKDRAIVAAPAPALPAAASPAPTTEENPMNLMLKMYLPQFIHLARAGADEETYANMILDHVPDAAVMQFVNRPDYMDYLASFDPAVREPVIAAWFEKLRVKLMEFLTEPEIPGLNDVNADISTDTL